MIEVGMISSGKMGEVYKWADGAQAGGVIFRYVPEENLAQGKNFSVLVTSGKIYDNRPHIFYVDENCESVPNTEKQIYMTPRAALRLRLNKATILGPLIGPRPGNGKNVGMCGSCESIKMPTVSINDPVSLASCDVVLVTEKSCWTEGFEAACRSWGIIVVTGKDWVSPNENWILTEPKWGWEKALREGMKRINGKAYTEALKRAGMITTGTEALAGAARIVLPNQNAPISRSLVSTPEAVRVIPAPKKNIPLPPPNYKNNNVTPVIQGEYKPPVIAEVSTPSWFQSSDPVEVSVIIPMWRSAEAVSQLIQSWDFSNPKHEIIFVNDACPHNSHQAVLNAFSTRQPTPPIGKILTHSHQSGFATSCNTGASCAKGKYIVFLNADTAVTENWLGTIIDPLKKDKSIGIVGNLQLKFDGTIDSAGSQWMEQTRSFEHIGRNVWKGTRLSKRITPYQAPPEMIEDGIRQMVTGCCIALEKSFFDEIGGFDIGYRIGYWEDADLCMKTWEKGKKVFFTGKSRIYHRGSHSGGGNHNMMKDNAKRFYQFWVDNGKLKNLLNI